MFTFDGWVTRVAFELHWALETRLHASALDSELAVYNVYSIGPRTLPCGTPALMSSTSEYVSLIFITKVLLLR